MKRIKIFIINATGLAAVNISLRFVSVSFNAYIAEKIGAESMGLFTLVMSVFGFAVIVACSGVNLASVRLSAERSAVLEKAGADRSEYVKCAGSVMRSCVLYSLLFSVSASVLLLCLSRVIGVYLLGDERCVSSLRIIAFSLPAISVSSAVSGYFTGVRKAYKNTFSIVGSQLFKIVFTATALAASIRLSADPVEHACLAVVGGASVSEGASLIINVLLYAFDRKIPASTRPGNGSVSLCSDAGVTLRDVAGISLPTAIGSYARTGLVTAEHLLIPWGLRRNGSTAAAALSSYGILQGMVFPLILFPSALLASFSSLLIPEVAGMAAVGDRKKIYETAQRALSVSLFFSVGTSAVFLLFAGDLGMSLYNDATACRQIFIMAPLIPVMYLDSTTDALLKGLGAQLDSMKINVIDATVSLVLVFFLVPRMGINGYIVTVYSCEIMNFVLSISRLRIISGFKPDVRRILISPFLCGAISSLIAFALKSLLPESSYRTPGLIMIFALSDGFFFWLTERKKIFYRKRRKAE